MQESAIIPSRNDLVPFSGVRQAVANMFSPRGGKPNSGKLMEVPISSIKPRVGLSIRSENKKFTEMLVDSIANYDQITTIIVDRNYRIIDGEQLYEALKRQNVNGIGEINVLVRVMDFDSEAEEGKAFITQIVANGMRRKYTHDQKLFIIKQLERFGYERGKQSKVAGKFSLNTLVEAIFGVSRNQAMNLIDAAFSPQEVGRREEEFNKAESVIGFAQYCANPKSNVKLTKAFKAMEKCYADLREFQDIDLEIKSQIENVLKFLSTGIKVPPVATTQGDGAQEDRQSHSDGQDALG